MAGFIDAVGKYLARFEPPVSDPAVFRQYTEHLLRWASVRDEASRTALVDLMAQHDYAYASQWTAFYTIILLVASPFALGAGLRGCGLVLLLLLLIPILRRIDRYRRRRIAWHRLGEARPRVYRKVRVTDPSPGSRIFQSYWRSDDGTTNEVELDHPLELREAVDAADSWWQVDIPVPNKDGYGRVVWYSAAHDLGLVRQEPDGTYTLLAGGTIYFPYDPWTDRIDTDGYQ